MFVMAWDDKISQKIYCLSHNSVSSVQNDLETISFNRQHPKEQSVKRNSAEGYREVMGETHVQTESYAS